MNEMTLHVKRWLRKIHGDGCCCHSPLETFPLINGNSCWSIWTPILKMVTLFWSVILRLLVPAEQAELFLRSWPRSVSLQWTLTRVTHLVFSVSATEWALHWPLLKESVLKMLPSIIDSNSLGSSGWPVRVADVRRSEGRWPWALSCLPVGCHKV